MPLLPYDSTPFPNPVMPVPPDFLPGQGNNYYERAMAMPYARQLRGLGMVSNSPYHTDHWAGGDKVVNEANMIDDSVGNGIFDGPGAAPIQHAGSGLFESNYAEPGYLYREQMTRPGAVVSTQTGDQVMFRPGGGGWNEDMASTWRPYDAEVPRYYGAGATDSTADPDKKPASMAQWAVAGLIVGVAAALMVGTLKVKGR